jgi:hypothetical protein
MEHWIGDVQVSQRDDGTFTVDRADPIIAIHLEALTQAAEHGLAFDRGELVVAGQVRYRPVRWSDKLEGLVCWTVAPESCRCR